MKSKIFHACSECSHVLKRGEDFCPDHPEATIESVRDTTAARVLGSMTSDKKAAAVRANGKKGGRPTDNTKVWAVIVQYECRLGDPGTLVSRHTTHRAAREKARKTGFDSFLRIQNLTD